jgi:ketosteroid isomerase-like protein
MSATALDPTWRKIMRIRKILLFPLAPTVVAAATLSGLAQGHIRSKSDDVRKAIEATETQFSVLFAKGDIEALSQLYAEDAVVMAPNAATVFGRPAIQDFWQAARNAGIQRLNVRTVEVSGTGGDTTYEAGTYVLYDKSGKEIDDGKYIVIWRREGTPWRLYRDIWNSNRK